MKRKELTDILSNESLDTDARIKAILDIYHTEVDALKDERDTLNTQLEAANGAAEKSRVEFEEYKAATIAEKARGEKAEAYKQLLVNAGIPEKRLNTVLKTVNLDAIEVENGVVKDSEAIVESIKAEWAELIPTQVVAGADTPTPPATDPRPAYTREDIATMSADEINKNWAVIKDALKNN